MASAWYHKPESALKRTNELIAIGNFNGALDLLQGIFATRKYKTWQIAYEALMMKFIELCIDLQRPREIKDGLHQYRNMTQQQAPNSLEIIINYLIDISENRATNARLKANAISAVEVKQIGDLEAEASPESIMLSTMTEEGGKERTDREVVVPWLKFLWEAYRTVLDILKTNTKLEQVYHSTCIKAFNFCKIYVRTTEFRRLCDTLRQHISNLQRFSQSTSTNKLKGWEGWTNENIELHLQTRFAQLEVSANLELWNEGFRTVEDIYNIMQIGKKIPKARLMASYYEKLTRIFLVSENHLFHAYAWYKYYTLSKEHNKALKVEERKEQACCVLLAALSIPEVKSAKADGDVYNDDDLSKEKNQKMAMLLNFNVDPSRANLLKELVSKDLLSQVVPELKTLYCQLEGTESPLKIVGNMIPVLNFIKSEENKSKFGVYLKSLENVIVLRVLEGMKSLFQTVSLDKFKSYLRGLEMDFQEVEKLVVRVSKEKNLQVTIDYQMNCLRFAPAVMETDGMRNQLTSLAMQLNNVVEMIENLDIEKKKKSDEKQLACRKELFAKIRSKVEVEHLSTLARKDIIEKRKEETERREQIKIREAARLRAEEEARRKEEEASRLEREAKMREKEKLEKLENELAIAETKNVLNKLGKKVDNIEQMDQKERETMIKTAKNEILSEKDKEEKRMKEQARRMDYIVRAMRMEELPIVRKKEEQQIKEDKIDQKRRMEELKVRHREEWENAVKLKEKCQKMLPFKKDFEDLVTERKKLSFEIEFEEAKKRAIEMHKQRKIERATQRKNEAEEAHKAKIEEQERLKEEQEKERERIAERERNEANAIKEAEDLAIRRGQKADTEGWQTKGPSRASESNTNRPWRSSQRSSLEPLAETRRELQYENRRGSYGGRDRGYDQPMRDGPPLDRGNAERAVSWRRSGSLSANVQAGNQQSNSEQRMDRGPPPKGRGRSLTELANSYGK
mmetsp:Transcript_7673/g.11534  ORF Transcript_7673/g.11534 Transcript_7673/m.11534 type:complete len:968 (+) Transcript_7673:90-2993(+)